MSRARSPGTFKYKPGPVPTPRGRSAPRPKVARWTEHDELGRDNKGGISQLWRYIASRVERRGKDGGFEAFHDGKSIGTFDTLSEACAAVEARYR